MRATTRWIVAREKGGPRHPLIPLPLLPSGPGGVHRCHVTRDHKTFASRSGLGGSGGRGIRTLGTFQYTRFPIVHLRPLGHPSNGVGSMGFAEEEGFEPPVHCCTSDFESDTIGHSDTPPET